MDGIASVSFDQEVMFFSKNANTIIIIHSLAGGYDGLQQRREILSKKGGKWTEEGQLVIARDAAAATKILVNTN